MHEPKQRSSAPEGSGALLPKGRAGSLGTTLQIAAGIVGGGSLLIWLWQRAEASRNRREAIYTHTYVSASPPFGPKPPLHRCLPSHWHRAYAYDCLEMHSTFMGRYAVVRQSWTGRYYVLGRIPALPDGWERFEDIYGIFESGRLTYYVFLPEQGVDGYDSRVRARQVIASQHVAPTLPSASAQEGGSPFLPGSPPWLTEQEGDHRGADGQERQEVR